MLQKVGVHITCQTLWGNVEPIELFTNDTTPHVYGNAVLEVDIDSCML
jgi:hypothetical protein